MRWGIRYTLAKINANAFFSFVLSSNPSRQNMSRGRVRVAYKYTQVFRRTARTSIRGTGVSVNGMPGAARCGWLFIKMLVIVVFGSVCVGLQRYLN